MVTKVDLFRFMADPRNKFAVVGSQGVGGGGPQAALVGIAVTEGLEVIFDTVKSSRKYKNLSADPRCSFVIGVSGDKTVQFEGEARELTSGDSELRSIYFSAFPDGPSRQNWPGIVYLAVKPKWVRFCDYGDTPHTIEEFRF
jgi:hypothetical protein